MIIPVYGTITLYNVTVSAVDGISGYDISTPDRAEALAFLGKFDHEGSSVLLRLWYVRIRDHRVEKARVSKTVDGEQVYQLLRGEQSMRTITGHHDGHGLNEAILIEADAPDWDAGGASHRYECTIAGADAARIQFQHGPRHVAGSTPGVTEATLLAILIDRLEGFQAGPYACAENDTVLSHLDGALKAVKARADARAARGVLGTTKL